MTTGRAWGHAIAAVVLAYGLYPWAYPILGWILALGGAILDPNFGAMLEIVAELGSDSSVTGEHPAISALSYQEKVSLVYHLVLFPVPLFLLASIVAGILAVVGRIAARRAPKLAAVVEVCASIVAFFPLSVFLLFGVVAFFASYVPLLSAGFWPFVFGVLLFPLVVAKVLVSLFPMLAVAHSAIPAVLAVGAPGGTAQRAVSKLWDAWQ